MIDVTKASRETLEAIASEVDRNWPAQYQIADNELYKEEGRLLVKLRAECAAPKLRSRAEVDADRHQVEHAIANILFGCPSSNAWNLQSAKPYNFAAQVPSAEGLQNLKERWLDLCKEAVSAPHHDEPTAEEPAELDLAEHEVCGCEEAEGLKVRVALLEQQNSGLLEQLKLVDNHSAEHFKARAEKAEARAAILEEQFRQSEYYVRYAKNMAKMVLNTLELAK